MVTTRSSFFIALAPRPFSASEHRQSARTPPSTCTWHGPALRSQGIFIESVTVLYNYTSFLIQRAVVQCLSLAVVCPKCGLNGDMLLSAIRTTYNIALMSRAPNVQKVRLSATPESNEGQGCP